VNQWKKDFEVLSQRQLWFSLSLFKIEFYLQVLMYNNLLFSFVRVEEGCNIVQSCACVPIWDNLIWFE
jgi:hypothetical protein